MAKRRTTTRPAPKRSAAKRSPAKAAKKPASPRGKRRPAALKKVNKKPTRDGAARAADSADVMVTQTMTQTSLMIVAAGGTCTITQPAPGSAHTAGMPIAVRFEHGYDPMSVMEVRAACLAALPADPFEIPLTAMMLGPTANPQVWQGSVNAPLGGTGTHQIVAWVVIRRTDCRDNVGVTINPMPLPPSPP